jgi:hypothetical protein
LLDGLPYRVLQAAIQILFYEVRNYFGIGFSLEGVAFGGKLFPETEVVFYDAVVNDDDLALAIAMRMGVLFSGPWVAQRVWPIP